MYFLCISKYWVNQTYGQMMALDENAGYHQAITIHAEEHLNIRAKFEGNPSSCC